MHLFSFSFPVMHCNKFKNIKNDCFDATLRHFIYNKIEQFSRVKKIELDKNFVLEKMNKDKISMNFCIFTMFLLTRFLVCRNFVIDFKLTSR